MKTIVLKCGELLGVGDRKGSLRIEEIKKGPNGGIYFICRCDCGNIRKKYSGNWLSGNRASCGCKKSQYAKEDGARGGMPRKNHDKKITKDGYIMVRIPGKGVFLPEHRIVMEKYLGRPLRRGLETVHHKNGIRHDNDINNLELWVKSHPSGQRVIDKIKWAKQILDDYSDEEELLSR